MADGARARAPGARRAALPPLLLHRPLARHVQDPHADDAAGGDRGEAQAPAGARAGAAAAARARGARRPPRQGPRARRALPARAHARRRGGGRADARAAGAGEVRAVRAHVLRLQQGGRAAALLPYHPHPRPPARPALPGQGPAAARDGRPARRAVHRRVRPGHRQAAHERRAAGMLPAARGPPTGRAAGGVDRAQLVDLAERPALRDDPRLLRREGGAVLRVHRLLHAVDDVRVRRGRARDQRVLSRPPSFLLATTHSSTRFPLSRLLYLLPQPGTSPSWAWASSWA